MEVETAATIVCLRRLLTSIQTALKGADDELREILVEAGEE